MLEDGDEDGGEGRAADEVVFVAVGGRGACFEQQDWDGRSWGVGREGWASCCWSGHRGIITAIRSASLRRQWLRETSRICKAVGL